MNDWEGTLHWLNRGGRYAGVTAIMAIVASVWGYFIDPRYWLACVLGIGYGLLGLTVAYSLSRLAANERQQRRLHRIVTG